MRANYINNTTANSKFLRAEDELRRIFEDKSIYEMSVWVREHAQYLKWFCGFNEAKIEAVIQPFMQLSFYLYNNCKNDAEAIKDFREFCIKCIIELETNCR